MQEVKVIGSFQSKFESTNRIYDVGGCSPTLSTMQGGNQEPKVIVEELGFMDNGTGKHQSNTVYNKNGLSPSITTITGGGTQQIKICEQIPCKLNKMPEGHLDSLDNAKNMMLDTVLILASMTLHDEFGFGKERLQRFIKRFNFKAECIGEGYTSWKEQIDILKDECGLEYQIRMNDKNVRMEK